MAPTIHPEVALARSSVLHSLPAVAFALALAAAPASAAEVNAQANYVISAGGTIVANARFNLRDNGSAYSLTLEANISGMASLVSSGTGSASSAGVSTSSGLKSQKFSLLTRSGGDDFNVNIGYAAGDVTAFMVTPPIVNNIDRIPIERKQLHGVNDMMAAFILKGNALDRSLCSYKAQVFTGVERFDLAFHYTKDDVATSLKTGYQGPVVLCSVAYKPISGHYTTSELTRSLAQDDRILVWYAPLGTTGYFIPYRVLLTTSMGDFSMVLTSLKN